MNRIKDYIGFAIWFAGLGYIALWPVTSPDSGGKPFGASIFCRDTPLSVLDFLCHSALPLQLPPSLHVLGFLSALFVTVRLLLYAFKRSRRAVGTRAADLSALRDAIAGRGCRRRGENRCAPLRPVKPRTHFGLRGMPH